MLLNSVQLFLRAEKQLIHAVAAATRGLHITSILSQTNRFMQSEPLKNDIEEILLVPNPSGEQWNRVYNYFTSERGKNVLSPYLGILQSIKQIDEKGYHIKAFKLYNHLKDNNFKFNMAEKLAYMKICFLNRNIVNERCKKDLECLYDEFMTKSPYVDSKTLLGCLEALSLTNRWEEVENVMQEHNNLNTLSGRVLSCLALASFKNNRFDKGWSLIKQAYETNSYIEEYVYNDLIHICGRNKNTFRNNVETIFKLWGDYCVVPRKDIISEYIRMFRKLGLNAWYTTIFASGQCARCDTFLRKSHLNQEEHDELAKYALDHFIIGTDVYLKSHPKELENLHKFVEASKPYDVVIDGLNIYYTFYKNASESCRRNIARVLDDLKQNAKGVVVILRMHVKKDSQFMQLLKGTNVFYMDNMSKDDPFLLYVVWSSEPNAKFISGDIVRDHLAALPNHRSRMLFTKWMLTHRYSLRTNCTLVKPVEYDHTAHKNETAWHIPYRTAPAARQANFLNLNVKHEWTCFRFE